jgi:aspartate-semialdehyde dehydrogenase
LIQSLKEENLYNIDLVFFASDVQTSKKYGSLASKYGFMAIDLCGAFNSQEEIPLVVSGVNDNILKKEDWIVANPHPLSIILSLFIHFLNKNSLLNKVLAIAFQPVSEYEKNGIDELMNQSIGFLNMSRIPKNIFKEQIAFNLISQVGRLEEDGFTDLEKNIVKEVRRIVRIKDFPLSLRLIHAPIFHGYSIMVFIECKTSPQISEIESILKKSSIFEISPIGSLPPSPISAVGKDKIFIDNIKKDSYIPNSFWTWIVADNLTRGSVLNAIEVAEKLLSLRHWGT